MDPYSLLGVSKSASDEEIRTAYRKQAKKYHPDLNPGNKSAELKFKDINTANEILSDPTKRAQFDRGEIDETGAPRFTQSQSEAGSAGGGPYYYQTQHDGGRYSSRFSNMDSDLFEQLFGRAAKEGMFTQQADQSYFLEVDFREAVIGAEKEIRLPTGKALKVKIPAGIDSGKKLRFKGFGMPAQGKAPASDAIVEIRVKPSKIFSRVGKDILFELPITISEAVLGGEVRVPTIDKPVMLKISAGTSTGAKLRLSGKGVGAPNSKDRGDLIATIKIVLPPERDLALEEAVRNCKTRVSYNPRVHLEVEDLK